jgi:hypothetical protein
MEIKKGEKRYHLSPSPFFILLIYIVSLFPTKIPNGLESQWGKRREKFSVLRSMSRVLYFSPVKVIINYQLG